MAHENQDTIICPHCDYEFGDHQMFFDDDDVCCVSCNNIFQLIVNTTYAFDTYKHPCESMPHEWVRTGDIFDNEERVDCKNCDEYNYIDKDGKLRFDA